MASLTLKAVQAKKLSEFFAAAAQVGLPCPCVQLLQPCRMYSSIDLPQRYRAQRCDPHRHQRLYLTKRTPY